MPRTMIESRNVVKSYDGVTAVDDLSFEIYEGEIFGLLGPNGAGKTTFIRAVMDIFKPDGGTIKVIGKHPGEMREAVGYLPEERGLYQNLKVIDVLVYLAELKGTVRSTAHRRAAALLERMDLGEWKRRKVKDLSRGMQQKLQIAACLVHDPLLLVLDEPFQGLDPINVDLVKTLLLDLQKEGKTVLLSTHQMNLVEVLCDRILLIDKGKAVLYGRLDEIKKSRSPAAVRLRTPASLDMLPGIALIEKIGDTYEVKLEGMTQQDLLKMLVERNIPVESFEPAMLPLEEIFIAVVRGEGDA